MTTITIQQLPNEPEKAILRFPHGSCYPIEIKSPFDEQQELQLEWYFEQYLKFPFTEQVRFKQIGASIQEYGENLFEQVFGQRRAYADYQNALLQDFCLEIVGDATFHALHWESLKDPDSAEPLAVRFSLTRKSVSFQSQPPAMSHQATPVLRVLLVTSRPQGKNDVAYRTISQPLLDAVLRNSQLPVQIDLLRPATYKALIQHLEECDQGFYHVLHFDVHGSVLDYATLQQGVQQGAFLFDAHYGTTELEPYDGEKAFLFLDGEENKAQAVEADDLKVLLARHGIPVVVLNACQSAKQRAGQETSLGSLLMQAGIQGVVAMAYSVTVSAAVLYVKTLYQQLLQHQDFNAAVRRARFELYQDKSRSAYYNQSIDLEDWLLPVFYQQQPIKLALRDFYAEEEADWLENAALQYKPPVTEYGFVGRDLDVLEIEKRLNQHNVLLIQGMGGAGKTTLLHHLMNWWQVTHFVEQVFYFGYDEKAYTRQQILHTIARRVFSESDYLRRFQPLGEAAQQIMIVKQLSAIRHCLVLDNLESVTGATLSIPHYLDDKLQAELKDFLQALAGGKTLVLLGSRRDEAWLQYASVPYQLSGLDAEAASTLADKVLQRHQALHYRDGEQQQDLLTLLKLLAGYPLALEVVLANLKQQTPAQVLAALQQGDEEIDFASSDKTQSILACIEYSHSALSEEAQNLLLCLAPFKGILYQPLLETYSEKLQAQAAFASVSFDNWQTVLDEAKNGGLISSHEVNGFISLQPTLSYFLSHQLQHDERLQAIYCAFRELYDVVSPGLVGLMCSEEPHQKHKGQLFTHLENENLRFALQLGLTAQVSIANPYRALSYYFDSRQAQQQGLEMGLDILRSLEAYPQKLLQEQLGVEFIEIIYDIARRQFELKQYPAAQQSYQKTLSLIKKLTVLDKKSQASMQERVYTQLGGVEQGRRNWEQAQLHYQQALEISIEINDRQGQAITYGHLCAMALEQEQWQQAQYFGDKALKINIEINDRSGQANTYHLLGGVEQGRRNWEQAQLHYQQALEIKGKLGECYSQASTYNELGMVALGQAGDYFQQEQKLGICNKFDDRYSKACTYQKLGMAAQGQAHDYFQLELEICIKFDDQYHQAVVYNNLGKLAMEQYQWQQAQEYFLKALKIYVAFQDEYWKDIILTSLKSGYQNQQQEQVVTTASTAMQIATILGISEEDAMALLA